MIIRVKINPLSKWCLEALSRDNGDFHKLVGGVIEINTEVTRSTITPCGGRAWLVTDSSREWTREVLQLDIVHYFVCEHQIEIGD